MNAVTRPQGSYLHLDVPSVSWIIEFKSFQHAPTDSSKGPHIAHMRAKFDPQCRGYELIAESCMPPNASFSTCSAFTYDEISFTFPDWVKKRVELFGCSEVVRVEEDKDFWRKLSPESINPSNACVPVPRARLVDDECSKVFGHLGRDISRSVVDDENTVNRVGSMLEFGEKSRKSFTFVSSRNQNRCSDSFFQG